MIISGIWQFDNGLALTLYALSHPTNSHKKLTPCKTNASRYFSDVIAVEFEDIDGYIKGNRCLRDNLSFKTLWANKNHQNVYWKNDPKPIVHALFFHHCIRLMVVALGMKYGPLFFFWQPYLYLFVLNNPSQQPFLEMLFTTSPFGCLGFKGLLLSLYSF